MVTAEPIAYDLSGPSDGALAHEHLSGAEEAFAELYRRYYPRLVRLCARRTGDIHLAEDIAQETLVRALRYLGGFDTSRPMWPWLKTIATRIAYQSSQKTAGERCSDLDQEDPEAYAVESPCHRIDDQLVLTAALDKVPARQRAALIMRYVDDWSTADSARFAGMTVPAFEQLLFRARRRLGTEYRRLTEPRRAGAFGLLFVFRKARTAIRARVDAVGLGGGVVGTGLMGVATMGAAVTVIAGPQPVTAPHLAGRTTVRQLDTSDVLGRLHQIELAANATSLDLARTASRGHGASSPASERAATHEHVSYRLGQANAGGDVNKQPAGEGKTFSVRVTVNGPGGPYSVGAEYDRGAESSVECYDTHCEVDLPDAPPAR